MTKRVKPPIVSAEKKCWHCGKLTTFRYKFGLIKLCKDCYKYYKSALNEDNRNFV